MFQDATTQKKRSAQSRFVTLVERHRNHEPFGDHDWVDGRVLDLTGQKESYRTVVVLIVGIMMDEFMQVWTNYQNRSPLDHGNQKQRGNLRSGESRKILSNADLFGSSFSVHETH
jgi:hypothetical protein